ncbi:MAG: glycosyltransferase family 39 protein [Candidatus Zixiibacteriota bacterium]|nr:MAG: glycosyltransferase family 39 protein [candidate division Zixibacteria bacterium]
MTSKYTAGLKPVRTGIQTLTMPIAFLKFAAVIRRFLTKLRVGPRRYYIVIFVSALTARFIWFALVLNQVDAEQLGYESRDSDITSYFISADAIGSDFDFSTSGVYIFGPGYPSLLALIGSLAGSDPRVLIVIQIVISSIAAVLLAVLAMKLTSDTRIALIAGMLNALSVLSIALANTLFSDTLFFILVLAGILTYLSSIERNKIWLSLLSGLLLSAAAFTKSMGQFLIIILVLMTALKNPIPGVGRTRMFVRRLRLLVPAVLVVTLATIAWTVRNSHVYDVPYLAGAAPEGMAKVSLMIQSSVEGASFDERLQAVRAEVEQREDATGRGEQVYLDYARALPNLVWQHPLTAARVFLRNVVVNTNTGWGVVHVNLPRWEKPYYRLTCFLNKTGLSFRVTILAIIGCVMLFRARRYSLAVMLLSIYAYFAFFSGFSTYQGIRIFYAGQIAWTMLAAYPLLSACQALQDYRSKRKQRSQT